MYKVYILRSNKFGRYYIGCTKNLYNRLDLHNKGKVRWTKAYCPWEIVYTEEYEKKEEAYKREKEIKSYKGGEGFKRLINK